MQGFLPTIRLDKRFLPQERLDIKLRERMSLFPWRGQFSPGLVEALMDAYATTDSVVLDPFMGSGTTLYEASLRNLECYGAEINPAALYLGGMAKFTVLPLHSRINVISTAEDLITRHTSQYLSPTLFSAERKEGVNIVDEASIRTLLLQAGEDEFVEKLVISSMMLAMKDGSTLNADRFLVAFNRNCEIVKSLPLSTKPCDVYLRDARALPLPDRSVDLVITSTPYINVFNYHQNYRPAMEIAGWDLLKIAQSEIGSNRKHRGNRFLTVVQFCIDLAHVLGELRRVIKENGRAIFIIGRESKVRGIAFNNGEILAGVCVGGCGFDLERWQERQFKNRFGEVIYEEILTFKPKGSAQCDPTEIGRRIGAAALVKASEKSAGEVGESVKQALRQVEQISASPLLIAHRKTLF